jgi:hypothetical protein
MARPKCDTPLVKFGRERGMDSIMSQLHYCYSLLFLHIIFFFSFFTRGNYLPTNHGAVIAGPALFSLPAPRYNPVPLYDPATASTFHLGAIQ